MNDSPQQFYSKRLAEHTQRHRSLRRRAVTVSALRLAAFILFGFSAYRFFQDYQLPWLLASATLLVCFIILVKLFLDLSARKRLAEKLIFLTQNELSILEQGSNQFPDGAETTDRSIYADDLDVFGQGSLFHLLNRTTTSHGKAALAARLNYPAGNRADINAQQEAVRMLSAQPDQRQLITAYGLLQTEEKEDLRNLREWLDTENRIRGKRWLSIVRVMLPPLNLAALLYYLSENNPLFLLAGVAVSWLCTGSYAKYILAQHLLIGKKQAVLEQYASILKQFGPADPGQSTILGRLQATALAAHRQIHRLSRLSALFDQRLNLLVNLVMNSLLLYDIQCMAALEKWKQDNRAHLDNWLNAVGEIEVLNSFATFAFNHPGYTFPLISEGAPTIGAAHLGHPLIPPGTQITNDITIGEADRVLLITGSNMSGKSTFLRTVGLNLVLAQCGMPVCASRFECTPMQILSSIRINDSLQENTSYFMAELKRLKEVITTLANGTPALILIDEVLRGTNSDDKTQGSVAFIQKLMQHNCLVLFATHDLSLGELEQEYTGVVANYCFESQIEDGNLSFDYRLRRGIATNKNASFLMQKMGIV